jgi:hypothetical protein
MDTDKPRTDPAALAAAFAGLAQHPLGDSRAFLESRRGARFHRLEPIDGFAWSDLLAGGSGTALLHRGGPTAPKRLTIAADAAGNVTVKGLPTELADAALLFGKFDFSAGCRAKSGDNLPLQATAPAQAAALAEAPWRMLAEQQEHSLAADPKTLPPLRVGIIPGERLKVWCASLPPGAEHQVLMVELTYRTARGPARCVRPVLVERDGDDAGDATGFLDPPPDALGGPATWTIRPLRPADFDALDPELADAALATQEYRTLPLTVKGEHGYGEFFDDGQREAVRITPMAFLETVGKLGAKEVQP